MRTPIKYLFEFTKDNFKKKQSYTLLLFFFMMNG